jgi:hypothetical protein
MRPRVPDRIFRDSPEPERVEDDLFVFFFPNELREWLTNTTVRCRWLDAEVPWKPLDDGGDGEDFCDEVSSYLPR